MHWVWAHGLQTIPGDHKIKRKCFAEACLPERTEPTCLRSACRRLARVCDQRSFVVRSSDEYGIMQAWCRALYNFQLVFHTPLGSDEGVLHVFGITQFQVESSPQPLSEQERALLEMGERDRDAYAQGLPVPLAAPDSNHTVTSAASTSAKRDDSNDVARAPQWQRLPLCVDKVRACANTQCATRKSLRYVKLRSCGRCKSAWYCSVGCQKAHWRDHKPQCSLP